MPLLLQISYHRYDAIYLLISDILTNDLNINLMFFIIIKLWGHKNPGTAPRGGASFFYSLLKKKMVDSSPHALFNTYMTAPFNLEVQF